MKPEQIEALADARAAINGKGLEKAGWYWSNSFGAHHHNTVRSLIDLGYLKTYAQGEIAHITESGEQALSVELEMMSEEGGQP